MKKEIIRKYKIFSILQEKPEEVINIIVNKRLSLYGISKNEIEELISERSECKKTKNYNKADEIRKVLLDKNILINDSKTGTTWDINIR